ncbi:MAG: bifunctional biotin--[acetyl-CoA-carboxylase] ligase/biotin operon repressor BirA [Porticoccaceae bacterium]
MREKPLISLLADGRLHSGEWLGEQLGISRTAVWKQLNNLEELGLDIESVRGQGYRIAGGIELLDPVSIRQHIAAGVRPGLGRFDILDEVASTNDWIKALQPGQQWRGAVCLAERQTSGRGRRGRAWVSPFGRNIYLSLGWEFSGGAASLEGLSLAVGVAVCRALGGKARHPELQLKWPNDILYQGRKLGGVLVEMQGDPTGSCQIVIGVGLNHGMAGHIQGIDQQWADATAFSTQGRNELAGRLISELLLMINDFGANGFRGFREEWSRYDAAVNRVVTLSTVAATTEGVCRGIAENGAVLIETETGLKQFNGGEITLRVQP